MVNSNELLLNSPDMPGTVLAAGNNWQLVISYKGGGKTMPKRQKCKSIIIAHCGVRAMSYINCYRNSDEELSNSGNGGVKEKYQKEGNT